MESVLLILEFVLTVLITIVVMLQKSSSIGLGAYSGSNETVFGAKGPAAFLAKVTMFFSILFVINTVALGYVYSTKSTASVMDGSAVKVEKSNVPAAPVPPAVPAAK
jgi:preprotein translocase subunit SecG